MSKDKHFDCFHDGIGQALNGRRLLERALPFQKLCLRNERESGICAQLRSSGELSKTAARHLSNTSMLTYNESRGGKDRNRLGNCRQLLADIAGGRPIVKQRRKSVKPITKCPSYKHVTAATEDPAKFLDAGLSITNVMPDMR